MGKEGLYIAKKVPVLTTTQRDLLIAVEGMLIFNSTTDQLEEYDGATWQAVGQVILTTHAADLDAHMGDLGQYLRTSEYHILGYNISGSGTFTLVANTLYAHPLRIPRDISLSGIAIMVTTAASGKSIRMGIFNDGTNLYPGNLLKDCGTVSTTSTGVKAISLSPVIALTKGRVYWLACVSDGTPIVRTGYQVAYNVAGVPATDIGDPYEGWGVSFTYDVLPNPFTAGGTQRKSSDKVPVMAVLVNSLD